MMMLRRALYFILVVILFTLMITFICMGDYIYAVIAESTIVWVILRARIDDAGRKDGDR